MSTCRKIAFLLVVIVFATGVQFATADAITTIANPSFEQPFIPPGIDMLSTPTGWLAYSPGGGHPATINSSGSPSRMPNGAVAGNQAGWFDIEANSLPVGNTANAMYQPGAITCQAGMVYTVSLYNGFDAVKATEGAVHGGSVIQLFDDTWTEVGSMTFLAGSAGPGQWVYDEFSVSTADNPGLVNKGINFRIGPMSAGALESNNLWDNVVIDASPVPEPSTLMLLTAGLFGFLACRRRK